PILAPRGILYIGTPGQEQLLDDTERAFLDQQLEVRRVTAEQAVEMVPCLQGDKLIGAIYDPVASDMDVDVLHQGYLRGMARHGGILRCNAEVSQVHRDHDSWVIQLA